MVNGKMVNNPVVIKSIGVTVRCQPELVEGGHGNERRMDKAESPEL